MKTGAISKPLCSLLGVVLLLTVILLVANGCSKKSTNSTPEYNPHIDPANFVTGINNAFMPLTAGKTFVYTGEKAGARDSNAVIVTDQTKQILGVTCIVVHDKDFRNDTLAEETYDWYAQDSAGNVWYFGELALDYEGGVVISTEGSWEAGVDDAKPGIVMEAHPLVGDTYRQEYLVDVAEDMAQVLNLTDTTTVPYGHFSNCLKTKEWSPLNEGIIENKLYGSRVGNLSTMMVQGGTEYSELIAILTISTSTGE